MGALDDGERLSAADAATWRAWLEANHARSGGAWLLHVRRTEQDGVSYEDAVRQALCFGWIDGPVRTFDDGTVGQWFSPRRRGSGRAATNKARLAELEAAGLLAPAGIRHPDSGGRRIALSDLAGSRHHRDARRLRRACPTRALLSRDRRPGYCGSRPRSSRS